MLKEEVLSCDLCVVGGGLAGLCAAVAAARHEARVVLMRGRIMLGGNASSEIRGFVVRKERIIGRPASLRKLCWKICTGIHKKLLYLGFHSPGFCKAEKNITLLLNTTCFDAVTETGNFSNGRTGKVCSVRDYRMTTQQFFVVKDNYFADCILAPLCGASFMYGCSVRRYAGKGTGSV